MIPGFSFPADSVNNREIEMMLFLGKVEKKIAHLVNRGYQQQFHTSRGDFGATAEHLHMLHRFSEELKEAAGEPSLYNQSLGTTSDDHLYDRLKGRDIPEAKRPTPAWELPSGH